MISSILCYHSRGLWPLQYCSRPILLLLLACLSLPAGLPRCCCELNVTLFSRVTLTRKPQSTSDLDHFHAHELPCSHGKSRDDPISSRRGDSGVPCSFIEICLYDKFYSFLSTDELQFGLTKIFGLNAVTYTKNAYSHINVTGK